VSYQIAATRSNFVLLVACYKTNFGVRVYSICVNLRPSAVEILVQNARRRVIVLQMKEPGHVHGRNLAKRKACCYSSRRAYCRAARIVRQEQSGPSQTGGTSVSVRPARSDIAGWPRHAVSQQEQAAFCADHQGHRGKHPCGGSGRLHALSGGAMFHRGGPRKVFWNQRGKGDWFREVRPRAIHLRRTEAAPPQPAGDQAKAAPIARKISRPKNLRFHEPGEFRLRNFVAVSPPDASRRCRREKCLACCAHKSRGHEKGKIISVISCADKRSLFASDLATSKNHIFRPIDTQRIEDQEHG